MGKSWTERFFSRVNRYIVALLVILAGTGVRLGLRSANSSLFSHPQVDELEYTGTPDIPFRRPPGTYLLAGLPCAGILFGALSMAPSLLFLLLLPRRRESVAASFLLAVEPTLALSGIQLLPEAPAAALLALFLVLTRKGLHRSAGFVMGTAALFRGELLLLLPLSPLGGRKGLSMALHALAAVLPVVAVNMASGGPASVASTGGINLWIGSDWNLLTTPPGVEFEQLMETRPGDSFTARALDAVSRDPAGWVLRGFTKTLAFFSLPGPGRNIDSGRALRPVFPLLMVTAVFLAGAAGFRRDPASLLMAAGVASAFIFFPSVRYRAVFIPAFALAAMGTPWKRLLSGAAAVALLSLLLRYPGHVRPGLNTVLTAQNALRDDSTARCLSLLEEAELEGYTGADLHNIRASAMAREGTEFRLVLLEFGKALEAAPRSPTVWRNAAVFLWNYGRTEPAREAALTAVGLNPALRHELAPILME